MTLVGYRNVSFTRKDGTEVKGTSFYFSYPIDEKSGQGCAMDKAFFSPQRIERLSCQPTVGDEVEVIYNRYGKPEDMRIL